MSATPQPAPDAVRERDNERPIIVHCIGVLVEKFGADPLESAWAIFDYLGQPKSLAALSAPVPSPDGPTLINIIRSLGPPDPSDEEFEQGWAACQHAVDSVLCDAYSSSPSATGAAEPVAWRWRNHVGDFDWSEWHPLQSSQTPEEFRRQFSNGFARGEFELQPLYVQPGADERDPSLGLPKSQFAKYKTGAELDAENAGVKR